MRLRLETTDTDLQGLWRIVHSARPSTANVTVPKEALRRLLTDHHALYSVATGAVERGGKGHQVDAGPDQKSLL